MTPLQELVLISPYEEDHRLLQRSLSQTEWNIRWARTGQAAQGLLRGDAVSVVISECDLPEGTWKDILDQLRALPRPPLLIVTSRQADHRLWAEVLNLGGHDVLAKPLLGSEVARVVGLAGARWQRTGKIAPWNRNEARGGL
jgi:DNA-binding response OmpR family regulator